MDDFSPIPMAPSLDQVEDVFHEEAVAEDKQIADIFYAPQWSEKLELILKEEIETLNRPADPNLIAQEYKIEDLSNKKASAAIERVIERIKNAVSAVESAEREQGGQ